MDVCPLFSLKKVDVKPAIGCHVLASIVLRLHGIIIIIIIITRIIIIIITRIIIIITRIIIIIIIIIIKILLWAVSF